jgi:tetratricopeptide (TPR) repeat protein
MGKKILEAVLVTCSVLIAYVICEAGYRLYLYYTYAIRAEYFVVTRDARVAKLGVGQAGSVQGPYLPNTEYNNVYYSPANDVIYRHKVKTNNLGWTSQNAYSRSKPTGEYRIAVIGGSTTAAASNELAWTDVAQERLNKDPELLGALSVKQFTVLNLGIVGAEMEFLANPAAVIARRFSPDLLLVNFSIDNVGDSVSPNFKNILPEPDQIAEAGAASVPENGSPPDIVVNGVEVNLWCPEGVGKRSLSNDKCKVSPVWYIPPGRELPPAEVRAVKQEVARQRLLHIVLLSHRPLLLLEIIGKPVVPRAQAAAEPVGEITQQDRRFALALSALRLIRELVPNVLLTHNPHAWHAVPATKSSIDRLIGRISDEGFSIVDMHDQMPAPANSGEAANWYMFDGHWNDRGAQLYAEAIYRVLRTRLLADRGVKPSADHVACAAALKKFREGQALMASDARAAEDAFNEALAAVPANASVISKRAGYIECGFIADLRMERSILVEARGAEREAEDEWTRVRSLIDDPVTFYERRAALRRTRKNFTGALSDLSELLKLKPDNRYRVIRAETYMESGDPQRAADDLKEALKQQPKDLTLLFKSSQARMGVRDFVGVVADVDAALELAPGNAGLLFTRANARAQLGKLTEAVADYTRAIEAMPDHRPFYQARASALDLLGRKSEASEDRKKAGIGDY